MSNRQFLVDIDMNGNFITNVGLEQVTTLPTTDLFDGRIVSCQGSIYVYHNNQWLLQEGLQGATGGTGAQGVQGLQGLQGLQGKTGTTGAQGAKGTTGSQGTTGATGSQGTQGLQGKTGANGSVTNIVTSSTGNVVGSLSLSGTQITQTLTNCVPGTNSEATITTVNSDTVRPKTVSSSTTSVGLPTNKYSAVFAEFGYFDKLCSINQDGSNLSNIHVGSSVQPVYFEDGKVKACNMNLTGPQGTQGKAGTNGTGTQGTQGKTGATGPQGPTGPAGSTANMEIYSTPEALYQDNYGVGYAVWDLRDLEGQYGGRTYTTATTSLLHQVYNTLNIAIRVGENETQFEHYLMLINDIDGSVGGLEFPIGVYPDDWNNEIKLVHNLWYGQTVIVNPNHYVEVSVVCKTLVDATHGEYKAIILTVSSEMSLGNNNMIP